jgi:hypothetical protein
MGGRESQLLAWQWGQVTVTLFQDALDQNALLQARHLCGSVYVEVRLAEAVTAIFDFSF